MGKLLAFLGMTIGGWIGWTVGARFGLFVAFILGVVGTGIGLYLGRRVANDRF